MLLSEGGDLRGFVRRLFTGQGRVHTGLSGQLGCGSSLTPGQAPGTGGGAHSRRESWGPVNPTGTLGPFFHWPGALQPGRPDRGRRLGDSWARAKRS